MKVLNDLYTYSCYTGAVKEAAHTLTEAYINNAVVGWRANETGRSEQHDEFLFTLFKKIINEAMLTSRDFAIQVDGCKGILIWRIMGCWPSSINGTLKLARLIGWTAALRTWSKFQPSCDKVRRRVLGSCGRQFLSIGYLGVLPHEQHRGYGTALMQHVLDKADDAHYYVYAEVSDERTLGFFTQFGFTVRAEMNISPSSTTFLLIRDPVLRDEPVSLQVQPGRSKSS